MTRHVVSLAFLHDRVVKLAFPSIRWTPRMNALAALEFAYNSGGPNAPFDFTVRYFGSDFGYMLVAVDEVADEAPAHGAKAWMFYVNETKAQHGIDYEILVAGDAVEFRFEPYASDRLAGSPRYAKFG